MLTQLFELTSNNSESPKDDPQIRQTDINRAREVLGWEPKYSRQEGLKKTMEYLETTLVNGVINA